MGLTVVEAVRFLSLLVVSIFSALALCLTEFKTLEHDVGIGILHYSFEKQVYFYVENRCGS